MTRTAGPLICKLYNLVTRLEYVPPMLLTPEDLNFVGYTYKNFEAVKGLRRSFDANRSSSAERLSTDSI